MCFWGTTPPLEARWSWLARWTSDLEAGGLSLVTDVVLFP